MTPSPNINAPEISLKRLVYTYWQWQQPYIGRFLLGLLMIVLTNLSASMIPVLINQAIKGLDTLNSQLFNEQFLPILIQLLGLAALLFIVRVSSRVLLLGIGRGVEASLRRRLFDHLLKQASGFFHRHNTGDLMSRLSNDLTAVRYLAGGGTMLASNTLFAYVTKLPFMLALSPELTVWVLIVYPVCFWGMGRFATAMKQYATAVQEALGGLSTMASESLQSIAMLQGYAKEAEEAKRFTQLNKGYIDQADKLILNRTRLSTMMQLAGNLGLLLAVLVGGFQVLGLTLDLGDFVAMILYVEQLNWPTLSLGWMISMVQTARGSLVRLESLLAEPTEQETFTTDITLPQALQGTSKNQPLSLVAKQLSFAYEGGQPVFTPLSFRLSPGELVVVTGPVASGKTTLLKLLARQLEKPSGELAFETVNGESVNAETLNVAQHRSLVGLMPQQSFLFSQSLGMNLRVARPDSTDENVWQHLEQVSMKQEAEALAHQLETLLGERGVSLSGGQRQRVALGRSLLGAPPFLLLDDPFASVDVDTEAKLIETLQQYQQSGHCVVLATHRLSILPYATQHWTL